MRIRKIEIEKNIKTRLEFKPNLALNRPKENTYLDILLTDTELHIYDYNGREWQPSHNWQIERYHYLPLSTHRKIRKQIMSRYFKTHTTYNHTIDGTYTRPPTNDYRDSDTILAPIFFTPRKENE